MSQDDLTSMESSRVICMSEERPTTVFRFFNLAYDLRSTILALLLDIRQPVDLHSENYRANRQRLNIFLTCHRMHNEAYQVFYGRHAFRILPIEGRFFGDRIVPLIARLPKKYRAALTSLELQVGHGWNAPPKSWRVDERLGLENMISVHTLKIFARVDPSIEAFRGFRISKGFYTTFCRDILRQIVRLLPKLQWVEFDAADSVRLDGPLMTALIEEAASTHLQIGISNGLRLSQVESRHTVSEVS